jgi:hypothetical protein
MIDPPYGDESTGVAKQTCPCCGGTGYQEVEIREE